MYLGRSTSTYVDSPNLGFPYFNFLGGYQLKKHPVQKQKQKQKQKQI